jgi:DNA-binding protein HU-beta
MNKTELVEKMAKECTLSKSAAEQVLNSVLSAITEAMKTGDKVSLLGFGTFSVSERASREGRNPKTGETITISAKKVVKFKAGSKLLDTVQE